MPDHPVLRTAEFNKSRLKTYWLWQPIIVMACTIVMIPLIPVVLVVVLFVIDKYINRLECVLTTRTLEVKRGLLNRVESTVPLEKITDVQYYQGPIMRWLDIEGFRVETAGQSSGTSGYLVNMLGIKDTRGFRQAVLAQRDRTAGDQEDGMPRRAGGSDEPAGDAGTLTEIRDILVRIEQKLGDN